MLTGVKGLTRGLLGPLGVYAAARVLTRRFPRIVMYHGFRPAGITDPDFTAADVLAEQIRYLKRHFTLTTVTELAEQFRSRGEFPAGTVALTVDDGYVDFQRHALPVLKYYGVKATVFCASGLLAQDGWVWTDKVKYVFAAARGNKRIGSLEPTLDELRRLSPGVRDERIRSLAALGGVAFPVSPPEEYRLMGWDELREVARSGAAEIGAHTRTHPVLSTVGETEAWDEIRGSKEDIEGELGVEVKAFCYPNGKPADYTEAQKEMVRKAGYACGVASHLGYVAEPTDLFALPRVGSTNRDLNLFRKYLDGFEYLQSKLTRER